MENHIIGTRPTRSPIMPPGRVPSTAATRRTKSISCAACTGSAKRSISQKGMQALMLAV
jgi:hypothetical protein